MTVKGLIFDLDGVIVFTDQYHYKAWKQMADEKGIYFDQEINNRLRGVSRMESLEIILERYEGEPLSDEDKQKMAEEKNEIYKKLLEQMTPADVSDEVKETLDELRKRGYLLSIGSSSKKYGVGILSVMSILFKRSLLTFYAYFQFLLLLLFYCNYSEPMSLS